MTRRPRSAPSPVDLLLRAAEAIETATEPPAERYDDVDSAVAMANRLDVGRGASVWSSDTDAARGPSPSPR